MRREQIAAIENAFHALDAPVRDVAAELSRVAVRGLPQVRRSYDRVWQRFVDRRRAIAIEGASRIASLRAAALRKEIARRFPGRAQRPVSIPAVIQRVDVDAWFRRGDIELKRRFFELVGDLSTHTIRAAAAKRKRRTPGRAPRIDPHHAKFSYPDEDLPSEEIVRRAADFIVVGRGDYSASVGVRDIMRFADALVSRTVSSQEEGLIVGWRWTLSPAHDDASSSPDICDVFAEADVGLGPGIYLDSYLPNGGSGHPNCWCTLEPVWGSEEDAAEAPPRDYEDRVRALMASLGVRELPSAPDWMRAPQ